MSSEATFSVDRREAYYERVAHLIAKAPLWFYTRAENGRRIQQRIKPGDLKPFVFKKHEGKVTCITDAKKTNFK